SLVTQDSDLVRLWALPEAGLSIERVPLEGENSFAALSSDGALAIPTGQNLLNERKLRGTRAFHVATSRPAGPPLRTAGHVVGAAFSPDGRSVALLGALDVPSTEAEELVVCDWATGRREWRSALPSEPRSVSYGPEGRRLAVLCGGGEVLVLDSE